MMFTTQSMFTPQPSSCSLKTFSRAQSPTAGLEKSSTYILELRNSDFAQLTNCCINCFRLDEELAQRHFLASENRHFHLFHASQFLSRCSGSLSRSRSRVFDFIQSTNQSSSFGHNLYQSNVRSYLNYRAAIKV